ncbi:hypothetical protein ACFX2G_023238 [Malus domestica]
MPVVEDLGTYLGVPTMWGRSKHDALAFIKERILAKILGWKQQFLSKEGKEVLIKAVSLAIPTYPMNVLSGNSINLWKDNWVPGILNSRPIPKDGWEIDKTRVVASIIDTERRTWNEDEIGDLFFESAKAAISRIHIEDSCSPDRLIWPASKTGPYSVISGYWWLRNSTPARKLDRPSTSHSVLPQLGSSESKSSAWKAFTDANSRIHDLAPSPRNNHLCEVSWYTPHPSVLKINVDASWRHGASSTWVGLVIRDSRCLEVRRMEVLASFAAMDESLVVLEGIVLRAALGNSSQSKFVFGWLGRLSKLAPGLRFQDQQTVRQTSS